MYETKLLQIKCLIFYVSQDLSKLGGQFMSQKLYTVNSGLTGVKTWAMTMVISPSRVKWVGDHGYIGDNDHSDTTS